MDEAVIDLLATEYANSLPETNIEGVAETRVAAGKLIFNSNWLLFSYRFHVIRDIEIHTEFKRDQIAKQEDIFPWWHQVLQISLLCLYIYIYIYHVADIVWAERWWWVACQSNHHQRSVQIGGPALSIVWLLCSKLSCHAEHVMRCRANVWLVRAPIRRPRVARHQSTGGRGSCRRFRSFWMWNERRFRSSMRKDSRTCLVLTTNSKK